MTTFKPGDTVTVPDMSDLVDRQLTPEVESEFRRRLEAVGLKYGGEVRFPPFPPLDLKE